MVKSGYPNWANSSSAGRISILCIKRAGERYQHIHKHKAHMPRMEFTTGLTMVRTRADNSNLQTILWIPSCEAVKDVETFTCVEIVNSTLMVDSKNTLRHLHVHRAPL